MFGLHPSSIFTDQDIVTSYCYFKRSVGPADVRDVNLLF